MLDLDDGAHNDILNLMSMIKHNNSNCESIKCEAKGEFGLNIVYFQRKWIRQG